jgi:hypothetical protein
MKFNKDDRKKWKKFRMGKKSVISRAEYELVCQLHSAYYKHKLYYPCTCKPKEINKWIQDLNKVWENGN